MTVAQTRDGGYIATGDVLSPRGNCGYGLDGSGRPAVPENATAASRARGLNFDLWALRLDSEGEILWERCLGGPLNEVPAGGMESSDGALAVASSVWSRDDRQTGGESAGDGAWAAGIGPDGSTLWVRYYGSAGAERAFSFRAAPQGGWVMAGSAGPWGAENGSKRRNTALKIGSGGDVEWARQIPGKGRLADILPGPGGGYIAITVPYPASWGGGGHDFSLIGLDPSGQELWREQYGDAEGRPAASFGTASDGSIIASGAITREPGPGDKGGKDAWAMKLLP
jgi:hypothetical protein